MLTYAMRLQESMIMYCIDKANAIIVLLWWQLRENPLLARSVRIISGDNLHFYPRPVLALGYTVAACVCLPCVCVSTVQYRTKFGPDVQNTFIKIPIVLGEW